MPTFLGPRFPPTYNAQPPRMSPEDYDIWQRWLPQIRATAEAFYFDVGLGLPDQLPPSTDANQLLGWIRNNQKRADVIIERPLDVLLVEIRFNAQLNAVGRLHGYGLLLAEDNPFQNPVIQILVTNKRDSEVERACLSLHQVYEVV